MASPTRVPIAWILLAHVLGAAAIGALDAGKLGSAQLMQLTQKFSPAKAATPGTAASRRRV